LSEPFPATHSLKQAHYRLGGAVEITIRAASGGLGLFERLQKFQIPHARRPVLELVVCERPGDFPRDIKPHTGRYKGISWSMALEEAHGRADGRVYFYEASGSASPSFFLLTRMVFGPRVRRELLCFGGFSLIGSAFHYEDTIFILFGRPGSGKTRLLLAALEAGASLVGDDELVVDREGHVSGLYNHVELRYGTAAGTSLWNRLRTAEKIRLGFYRFVSLVTASKISLNLVKQPEELGLRSSRHTGKGRTVFVHLSSAGTKTKMGPDEVITEIAAYEADYRERYGGIFFGKEDFEKSTSSIRTFLTDCEIWHYPSQSRIEELLELV
jgi:hypothetical protein